MPFSADDIALARQLRDAGLRWTPAVGHYVYDEAGLIEVPSPFQERVYFILDLKHFLRRAGTIAQLQQAMFWLPQWHQARELARSHGVADQAIAEIVSRPRTLADHTELTSLLEVVLAALRTRSD